MDVVTYWQPLYTNLVLKLHWCSKYYIQFFSDGPVSKFLKWVKVPIITNSECRNTKLRNQLITEDMICAGYANGGKDACSGDSGSAIFTKEKNKVIQIGLVSGSLDVPCGTPGYPTFYTRVQYYLKWILDNLEE